MERNVTLKTIRSVENLFDDGKAWTAKGISTELNISFYSVGAAVSYLLTENKIKRLEASSRGELYIKNE